VISVNYLIGWSHPEDQPSPGKYDLLPVKQAVARIREKYPEVQFGAPYAEFLLEKYSIGKLMASRGIVVAHLKGDVVGLLRRVYPDGSAREGEWGAYEGELDATRRLLPAGVKPLKGLRRVWPVTDGKLYWMKPTFLKDRERIKELTRVVQIIPDTVDMMGWVLTKEVTDGPEVFMPLGTIRERVWNEGREKLRRFTHWNFYGPVTWPGVD
jgi:hypothetical protein